MTTVNYYYKVTRPPTDTQTNVLSTISPSSHDTSCVLWIKIESLNSHFVSVLTMLIQSGTLHLDGLFTTRLLYEWTYDPLSHAHIYMSH